MSDTRDEIDRIIQEAEQKAFERGWRAACELIGEGLKHLPIPSELPAEEIQEPLDQSSPPEAARRGRPSSRAIDIVADCIASQPGMKGVEVVKAAQEINPGIKERTVRTCLRRLRLSKAIWRRNGLWYPKSKHDARAEEIVSERPLSAASH